MTRKFMSFCTFGLIDYRSDKERIAKNTKRQAKATEEQNRILRGQQPPR